MASVGDILQQPQGGHSNSGSGQGETVVKKGDYADLLEEAGGLHVRDAHDYGADAQHPDVRYVQSWQLERAPGGLGVLTIKYEPSADDSSSDPDDDIVSEKWSVKNVQQQLPLSRFYLDGTWSATAPDGHELALWRQEPRKELYDAYKFLAPDGNAYELTAGGKLVADKYKKGIESVMRFYPVVTRTITYKRGMSDTKVNALGIGARLAHIDTPAKTFGLSGLTWLCIQDEAELAADGTVVRTTGWMGCKSLDADLYGDTDRWEPMN
jgi:hypothetical protein